MTDALDAVLAQLGNLSPDPLRVGPDGLLAPRTLRTLAETAEAFGASSRAVSYWRKRSWWPGTVDPDPWEVDAHALDAALRAQGLTTAVPRRAEKGMPRLELRGGNRDPRMAPSLDDAVDAMAAEAAIVPSAGLADDIARAREVAEHCRRAALAVKPQALADPARARVWNGTTNTYTQALQRIAQQERALMAVQRERGEVVSLEAAQAMLSALVAAAVEEAGARRAEVLDAVKRAELEAHGDSRIDSLVLEDTMAAADERWRRRMVERLQEAADGPGPERAPDGEPSGADGVRGDAG